MTVVRHYYEGYAGPLTARWQRTLVIFRYALADLFESQLFSVLFALCFLPSAVVMVLIYMRYNIEILIQLELDLEELVSIDAGFLASWMQAPQLGAAFVLVMLAGPTLVSPDLRNNALTLYLARSVSRRTYVTGKLMVLVMLCSMVTWVPAIGLVLFQAYLAGNGWLFDNASLLLAPMIVSLPWIVVLTLISLAVSSLVRWKVMSRLFFFGLFFMGAVISNALDAVFGGGLGSVFNVAHLSEIYVAGVYGIASEHDLGFVPAVLMFVLMAAASIFLLSRRLRALEHLS